MFKNKIINNTAWLLVEKAVSLLLGFVTTAILVRQLGAAIFGQYTYLVSYITLFIPLFSLGLAKILIRELSANPENDSKIISTARNARFYASILLSPIVLIIFYLLSNDDEYAYLIFLLLFAQFFSCFEVYEFWFQSKSLNKPLVIFRIIASIIFNTLKVFSVILSSELFNLVLILSLEWMFIKIGYLLLYKRQVKDRNAGSFDPQIFKELFQQSKFLIFSGVAAVIYLKIDIIMLQYLSTPEELGQYVIAAKLSEIWFVIPTLFVTALSPQMLNWYKKDKQKYFTRTQEFFSLLFWFAITITIIVYSAADFLISLIFGSGNLRALEILQVHIWALVFISMRQLFSHILVVLKYAQFSLISHLSAACINIVLNSILIPKYQGVGAAYATVFSYCTASYICLLWGKRTRVYFLMMTKAPSPMYLLNLLKKRTNKPNE